MSWGSQLFNQKRPADIISHVVEKKLIKLIFGNCAVLATTGVAQRLWFTGWFGTNLQTFFRKNELCKNLRLRRQTQSVMCKTNGDDLKQTYFMNSGFSCTSSWTRALTLWDRNWLLLWRNGCFKVRLLVL